mgnify:CR=1 FL=1
MKEIEFIAKSRERMWKIEGINAEAKYSHNLSRAKYRGIRKVQIQAYLTASAQNLKRIIGMLRLYNLSLLIKLYYSYKLVVN